MSKPGLLVTVILPERASMPDAGLIDGILRIGKECITWERPNGETCPADLAGWAH